MVPILASKAQKEPEALPGIDFDSFMSLDEDVIFEMNEMEEENAQNPRY